MSNITTTNAPNAAPPVPVPGGTNPSPPPGRTRLIKEAGDLQVFNTIQKTDARTAITRGLQEYLQTLEYVADGGRLMKFATVLNTWASAEDTAQYPGACVYAPGPATYDSSSFTNSLKAKGTNEANVYLRKPCEIQMDIIIEIYCTSTDQRHAISAMMELALNPTDFMYGFLLELPHYFNARAIFEPTSSEYVDDPVDAKQRKRRLLFGLTGTMPVLQRRGVINPLQVQVDSFLGNEDLDVEQA